MKQYSEENGIKIRDKEIDGLKDWMWPSCDDGSWEGPHMEWIKESRRILDRCKEKRTCIQAGGNMGLYPRLLAEHFKIVYTFEPDPYAFFCLVNNCQKDNIVKIQAGLGTKPGFCKVEILSKSNMGMSKIKENEGFIPVISLDTFDFQNVDLIMLDVEGYENHIVDGAKQTILNNLPVITMEGRREQAEEFLFQHGYQKQEDKFGVDFIYVHESKI